MQTLPDWIKVYIKDMADGDEKSLECFSKEWISSVTKDDLLTWLRNSREEAALFVLLRAVDNFSKE